MKSHTDAEIKAIVRDIFNENLDKIAAVIASKLKRKLIDRSKFVRNAHRLEFVKKYSTLCAEAYPGENHICLREWKKPAGRAIIELARQELNYKPTYYSGDIYRNIGITYLKSIDKWKY